MKYRIELLFSLGVILLFATASHAAVSCDSLRMPYALTQPRLDQLSAEELQVYPMHFMWVAEDENAAMKTAKQTIAESILNMVLTKGREETRSSGNSIEGAISEVNSSIDINTETQLDVPLPQPFVRTCSDNGHEKKMVIYTFPYGKLAEPSIKYLKDFRIHYSRYKKMGHSTAGFISLLEAYKRRLQVERRPGYLDGALKILGLQQNELIRLTELEKLLKREAEKITIKNAQSPIRLNPTDVVDRFTLQIPLELQLIYSKSQRLSNLPLLLKIDSTEPTFEQHQSDQFGKFKISELKLKLKDSNAGSSFTYFDNAPLTNFGQTEKEQQATIDKYCPTKITVGLLIADKNEIFGQRKSLNLVSYRVSCNSLSWLDFDEAKKNNTWDAYAGFIDQHPDAPEINEAEKLLFVLAKKNDTRESFETFLAERPQSPYRNKAVTLLYRKVLQEDSWEGYIDFIEQYPDSVEKRKVIQRLSDAARRLPEKSLSEKEEKMERMVFIESYAVGLNSGKIAQLKNKIQQEKNKRINNPATVDAYVFEMRTVHVPNKRVALGLDVTGINDNKMSLAEFEVGYGHKNIVGLLVGGKYNNVKWKEPIRSLYGNVQFRVFGKRKDNFSLALGATYTWRNSSYALKDKETLPGNDEGVDKEGKSQFVNDAIDSELYLTMVVKVPVIDTFFHLYAGNQTARVAMQYFIVPEFNFALEGYYRHQKIEVQDRDTDTEFNNDKQERMEQEKAQRTDVLVGIGLSTAVGKDAAQTKLYYSAQRKQTILRFSVPF